MQPIAIKGGKDGLRLVLADDAAWDDVLHALEAQLDTNPAFFHGIELTIDTGERPLSESELQTLLAVLDQHNLQPHAVATSTREGRTAARAAGVQAQPVPRPAVPAPATADLDSALLVQRTLRSGQVLRHPGHITLLGDVNPGAEISAGGSIIVWGRLRGAAHAGALGAPNVIVCALELSPTVLRIGDKVARMPESDARPTQPESARATEQGIEVEPWEGTRR